MKILNTIEVRTKAVIKSANKRCVDCLWYDAVGCVNKEVQREKVPNDNWGSCNKWEKDKQYLEEKAAGLYTPL